MLSVRQYAIPISPGCSVGETCDQSVVVKGRFGICMVQAPDVEGWASSIMPWRTRVPPTYSSPFQERPDHAKDRNEPGPDEAEHGLLPAAHDPEARACCEPQHYRCDSPLGSRLGEPAQPDKKFGPLHRRP